MDDRSVPHRLAERDVPFDCRRQELDAHAALDREADPGREFGIDEQHLIRTAVLEADLGLSTEQIERVLEFVAEGFEIRFPPGTLDEVVKLEELCLVASWLKGLYKRPAFIGPDYETTCRGLNPMASIEV